MVLDTALFPAGSWQREEKARGVGPIRRAIGEHRKLRFRYTRADGKETERSVRPLGLYFWGRKWTVAAWCEYGIYQKKRWVNPRAFIIGFWSRD